MKPTCARCRKLHDNFELCDRCAAIELVVGFLITAAVAGVIALLGACAPAAPSPPAITGACARSFRPTLEAWEAALGRVPHDCAYLDTQIDVQLVDQQSDLPCPPLAVNETLVGCTQGSTIYLLRGRDDVELVDTSVHEWLHALAQCVYGDADADHLRAGLWALYGAESVEIQAQASAQIGECL